MNERISRIQIMVARHVGGYCTWLPQMRTRECHGDKVGFKTSCILL